jgi:hypothetical protein
MLSLAAPSSVNPGSFELHSNANEKLQEQVLLRRASDALSHDTVEAAASALAKLYAFYSIHNEAERIYPLLERYALPPKGRVICGNFNQGYYLWDLYLAKALQKQGELKLAEWYYQIALDHVQDEVAKWRALQDYVKLLTVQGRTREAEKVKKELAELSEYLRFTWKDRYCLLDTSGRLVAELPFDYVQQWDGKLACGIVEQPGQTKNANSQYVQFFDRTGRVAINQKFSEALWFSEGLAPVSLNGKWGYIDQSGRFQIKPTFNEAHQFQEGLACVALVSFDATKMRFGFIDRTGKMAIKPQFQLPGSYLKGIAQVGRCASGASRRRNLALFVVS